MINNLLSSSNLCNGSENGSRRISLSGITFASNVDAETAIAVGNLFWPSFSDINGCIVLSDRTTNEEVSSWLKHFDGDIIQTEQMINHTHMYDLFMDSSITPDDSVYNWMGNTLKSTWQCALVQAFPSRSFVVLLFNDPDEYGPVITFHQCIT